MEVFSHSSTHPSILSLCNQLISFTNSSKPKLKTPFQVPFSLTQQIFDGQLRISSSNSPNFASYKPPLSIVNSPALVSAATLSSSTDSCSSENTHWVVLMDMPPEGIQSKEEIMNYYVSTLQIALGSENDARSCIYNASFDTQFGFCCNIDEGTSHVVASLPGVISVKPDPDINSFDNDYSTFNYQGNYVSKSPNGSTLLFSEGSKHWLVRVDKPSIEVSSKADSVDFYVNILTKVLGNEKDAQMCLYHVSWQSNFGFCCTLDEESAQELAVVPRVLSVQPDEHFVSENKDYGGGRQTPDTPDSTQTTEISKTKLFITGLSFYTSEKTLRAAFEPFGELVEVKVIMDKISKRSKGYAFVEYTTEAAATMALQEMNGKIINGWMIVVDRAKSKTRYSRGRPRPTSLQDR